MTDLLNIDVTTDSEGARLVVSGEVDVYTVDALRKALRDLTDLEHVTLDCADLRLLTSEGLGVLIAAAKRITAAGGRLELRNVASNIAKVIHITGVDSVLDLRE